ncbi:MAG: hypothetical protein GY874_05265 [Desulfobacteraceae bacterium]|nr:hypothetical protein [Desulfobacteraceae bacterium]
MRNVKTAVINFLFALVFLLSSNTMIFSEGHDGALEVFWPAELQSDLRQAAIAIANNWTDDRDPENQDWSWGEGVLAYGLIQTAKWSGKADYFNFVNRYLEYHQSENVDILWSDHVTPAMAGLYISLNMDDHKIYPITGKVVEYIMTAPRTGEQQLLKHLGYRADRFPYKLMNYPDAWVDSLFHITPTLIFQSQISDDDKYINEAANQIFKFAVNLQDPETGLFTHSYNDYPKDEQVPAFSNYEFWARANGWALTAIVELLAYLPADHDLYEAIEHHGLVLEKALRKNQGTDGRFHTLLTKSGTYYETAGTALILYAMARGVEIGLFGDFTQEAVEFGAQGLLDHTLTWKNDNTIANVDYISMGTNPSPGLYRFVPRRSQLSYGVGAWLMFASVIAG